MEDERGPVGPAEVTLAQAAARIAAASDVLLTCHRRPDGDSVGSLVALATLLRARGKRATLYNPDPVPRRLKWLPLGRNFRRKLARTIRYQVTVVTDCADRALLGRTFPPPEVTGTVVVLDHHPHGTPFGDIYLCDPEAASTGVLVARMARHLGWPLDPDAALGLYVSLCSDTGTFRYANTNAEALRLAAELVELGVDPWQVAETLYERSSMGRYRLLAEALGSLRLVCAGRVAIMTITADMVERASATWDDSVDLVSYTRALDGVECGVLITPSRGGGVRVSLRTKGGVDAGQVCAGFGGGGHRGAAGCILSGDLAAAAARIEAVLGEALGESMPAPAPAPPASDAATADVVTSVRDDEPRHGASPEKPLP
ncbi:DHH family phosphoesterase [Haliangium sp.]|uniref:DHH family phosphoesterase n=1 Tax=Haliangium sp. TaxID=2663208 RepID=UPI003D0FBF8A